MLSSFGMDCGATGFALGIERLLLALERQGIASVLGAKDSYIGWGRDKLVAAIRKGEELRKTGQRVEISLVAQTPAEAEASQKNKGYSQLLYME